jgi:hypothetical protein
MNVLPAVRRNVLFACLLTSACTGAIATGEQGEEPGGTAADPAAPTTGRQGSSGPVTMPTLPTAPTVTGDPTAAGPMPLRRLTRREYNNTVRDLLGDTSRPADGFPADRDPSFLFRNAGVVSEQDATAIRDAAEAMGALATKNAATLLPCQPTPDEAACARRFIETFGLRAWRRPLAAAEVDGLVAVFKKGRDVTGLALSFNEAAGLVIETMLQTAEFLYHWEFPSGPVPKTGPLALGPYQVAERLSYFIWGTIPDEALLAAAAANRLSATADVEAQVRRMLADKKARETVSAFFGDLMHVDELDSVAKDDKTYPMFTADVRAAMAAETRAFVENVVFDGDGKLATVLTAPYSFAGKALGVIYGTNKVTSAAPTRLDLDPTQRSGLLTQGAFLTVKGAPRGSNPPRRGAFLFGTMLCGALPPVPANVPPPADASTGGTTRQRFEMHDTQDCARACHGVIDPLGFAFESYDGIGRFRTTDNGGAVDASGKVTLDGAERPYRDAVGMSALLARSAGVQGCMARQWLRFGLGRVETDADAASLKQTADGFAAADGSIRELVVAVATSRSFRYRTLTPGEVTP